ncbi:MULTISPECIES: 3-deoxy-manno-octulosonate cytidylyltransferase [unclassified Chelatococcus]|uniref:3-deoxy-manno-octulosonate cytidylyltransferase n=1 Tax=unclassified Chelatococcus TaxID=2638111 RepID=UPI001BD19220|nr:3-deoxy-manno-octulosonate cytidylyltransferase [Chelatococcus sp.]MBS7737967.1 3-deoxy-manno-octulosonate cytidylyltransferase [Chelatococcus sp. HY11]CAH1666974.1 3-deoxy-manno-octulosonate cytidylyltransferase [Hyphomicrobiales bacterium]MBX3546394.1 3-deoxy-manno-octulosonate cytidylyltransferase [Chelatococcus sp.]MCO5077688.1 3-deoxy-manno-octulosonate cytidylyltransferase [Chelatococcus sp.]CAH1680148.1 3-deoxy-manno-octulosonate cytidylyltransferase [Hyphomicrobiales bacterium]
MKPIVVIPARRAATRLPGKPLADIAGEPMIVHVWRRAMEADVGSVLVATDDDEIADAIRSVGGDAVLTRSDHPSGSDRVFEAISLRDPDQHYDVIVNIQGDLPTIARDTIRDAMAPLADADVAIGTPVVEITVEEEKTAPSVVKMIGSPIGPRRFRALYFTRATAPSGEGPLYHHIGLYVWRRSALARFIALPPSPLELREKLEQLRAIEAGMRIDAVEVDAVPLGVDTQADLERARRIFAGAR